jgi:cell pole-organizing protein PopZ
MSVLKIFAVVALAALASANDDKAQIITDASGLNVRVPRSKDFIVRRDVAAETSLFDLQKKVDMLESTVAIQEAALSASATLTPYVGSSVGRIDDLVETVSAVTTQVDGVDDKLATVDKKLASETDKLNALLAKTVKDMEDANKKANDALTKSINTKVDNAIKEMNGKMDKSASDLKKQSDGITTAVANKLDAHRSIWVGGQIASRRGGWHEYVFDRVDFDASAPHFKRASSTRFQALTTGLFRVYSYQLMNGGWCHAHVHLRVNNRQVQENSHRWIPHTWDPVDMDMTWVIRKNQQFWIRYYSCDWGMHGSSQNNPNAHNRVIVSYEGKVDESKCQGYACKGMP